MIRHLLVGSVVAALLPCSVLRAQARDTTRLGCHWELWAMAAGGMTPREVLRVGTRDGAYGIGMDKDLGSLEPGKLADLIVLDANPLEDIHNTAKIRYVMKNGRLYEGDTLNEVWPKQRPLPRMWWWDQEPKGVK